jgi:putative transposase
MKKRKSPRWANWDYSTEGYYFVTAVTKDRLKLFGNIVLDEFIEMRNIADVGTGLRPVPTFYPMILNEYGKIVLECWNDLPNHYSDCALDEFVIMPNHIHGIINIIRKGKNSLSDIIGSLKSFSSRRINKLKIVLPESNDGNLYEVGTGLRPVPTGGIWQPRFHDRIIRDEMELYNVRNYIQNNPRNWLKDDLKEAA